MNRSVPALALLFLISIADCSYACTPAPCWPGGELSDYYDSVDLRSAQGMRDTLHELIDDHQRFPYTSSETDTWDVLKIADEDKDSVDGANIITIYRNASYPKQPGGNNFYNREHTWPRSYGFPDNRPDL